MGVEVKTGLHAYPSDKPGVPFHAGDDWFNHLTVVLKNISAKPIVYADTQLLFDETASHSPSVIAAGNQNRRKTYTRPLFAGRTEERRGAPPHPHRTRPGV